MSVTSQDAVLAKSSDSIIDNLSLRLCKLLPITDDESAVVGVSAHI